MQMTSVRSRTTAAIIVIADATDGQCFSQVPPVVEKVGQYRLYVWIIRSHPDLLSPGLSPAGPMYRM